MNADPNSLPHPAPRLWGHFELQTLVGRGAFGEVYRAWDTDLQREVAVKLLLPSAGDDAQYDRLLREARALASVRHPNIVPIYGVSQHDGLVGFWTDFVHGRHLAAFIKDQGTLGYREATLIGLDIAKALSAVHLTGLLHRDIKAENVMREDGGRILLMDFGLTVLPEREMDLAGSPRYMAPELFQGVPASVATDIYSVGILLFFLVTGTYPGVDRPDDYPAVSTHRTDGLTTVSYVPLTQRPLISRSILDYRPDLPESYVTIVDRCMETEPKRRFTSAGSLAAALSEVLSMPSSAIEQPAKPLKTDRSDWKSYLWGLISLFVFVPQARNFLLDLVHSGSYKPVANSTAATAPAANADYLKADILLLRYDKRKNVSDAVTLLQGVLKLDPDYALAHADLGRAYFLEYKVSLKPELLQQARAACNRAIQLDANLAPPYVTLARIEAKTGNTALATQQIRKAMQLDPRSPDAWGAQAEVYDAEGRPNDAITSAQGAIDRDPDSWRWPVLLGSYYFEIGKLQLAAEQFRNAIKLAPDNSTALLDLGLVSLQLKRPDVAKDSLQKAVQTEPSFAAYSALAELYASQGKYAQSVDFCHKALDLNPTNYRAWGNLGSAYLAVPGDRNEALSSYRTAILLAEASRKLSPKDPLLLANLGAYYAVVGKTEQSVSALRQAVVLAPESPDVLFQAGDGYEILGRREDAIRLISHSIALGFHSAQLEQSPELASLRVDARFQEAVRAEQAKLTLDNPGKSD